MSKQVIVNADFDADIVLSQIPEDYIVEFYGFSALLDVIGRDYCIEYFAIKEVEE